MTEDEMVGWHHSLNGPKFEQILGDDDREAWRAARVLACWDRSVSMTEQKHYMQMMQHYIQISSVTRENVRLHIFPPGSEIS